jgi:outer membrane protein
MKKSLMFIIIVMVSAMFAGTAGAESIKGRLGISGKVGINVPFESEINDSIGTKVKSDSGFATGGGLVFGITENLAIEADVTYVPTMDFTSNDQKIFEMETIIPSIGLQLRSNLLEDHLSVYLGGGVDLLFANPKDGAGNTADVDTKVGGHINGGGDYFMTKNIALNLDLRGIFFGSADIKAGGTTFASYNPVSFVATVGVKWFPW